MTPPPPIPPSPASAATARAATARGGAQLRDRVTAAIAAATVDELAERGFGAFSMSAVAVRAGVGKAALYRRWDAKLSMILEVITPLAMRGAEPPDTGTLQGDLHALLASLRDVLRDARVAPIATDLLAASLRDQELADALRAAIAVPRRTALAQVIERAARRGEVSDDVDADVVLDLLAGSQLVRVAVSGQAMDEPALHALQTMLLRALRP